MEGGDVLHHVKRDGELARMGNVRENMSRESARIPVSSGYVSLRGKCYFTGDPN